MTRVPSNILTVLAADRAIARVMGASRRQILTTLFLALPLDALDLIGWYRREVISGRFSPDPALVFSLFRAIDPKGKFDLVTSFCGSSLDTPSFMKLVAQVYRAHSLKGLERNYLAQAISLHASLYWDISTSEYEKLVRKMLVSRYWTERSNGAQSLGSLSGVHPDLCLRLTQLVRDRHPSVRTSAWYGASALLYWGRLTPEAHQLLLGESLEALKDPDKAVRGNARFFRRRSRIGLLAADRDRHARRPVRREARAGNVRAPCSCTPGTPNPARARARPLPRGRG